MAATYLLQIDQGSIREFDVLYRDANGDPVDVTAWGARAMLRAEPETDPLLTLGIGTGITNLGPAGFRVTISATASLALPVASGVFDVVGDPSGSPGPLSIRLVEGQWRMTRAITR